MRFLGFWAENGVLGEFCAACIPEPDSTSYCRVDLADFAVLPKILPPEGRCRRIFALSEPNAGGNTIWTLQLSFVGKHDLPEIFTAGKV